MSTKIIVTRLYGFELQDFSGTHCHVLCVQSFLCTISCSARSPSTKGPPLEQLAFPKVHKKRISFSINPGKLWSEGSTCSTLL